MLVAGGQPQRREDARERDPLVPGLDGGRVKLRAAR